MLRRRRGCVPRAGPGRDVRAGCGPRPDTGRPEWRSFCRVRSDERESMSPTVKGVLLVRRRTKSYLAAGMLIPAVVAAMAVNAMGTANAIANGEPVPDG